MTNEMYTGFQPLADPWKRPADNPSLSLASTRTIIGSLGLKNAIVSLLVIAPLTSLNALCSVGPH